MKKRLLMVDYYGMCDENGEAVGHSAKVLRDYRDLLDSDYEVSAALAPCFIEEAERLDFYTVRRLKYNIFAGDNRLGKRIVDKLKLFYNIHQVYEIKGIDAVWFYRVDFFLFLYIVLHRKKNKFACLIYHQNFTGGRLEWLLQKIYSYALKKIDLVIYTQKRTRVPHGNTCYIPDYYYDEARYGKYRGIPKKEKMVCVGTMGPYKKLEKLVEVFNKTGYPLEIAGFFYDTQRLERLKENAASNITICNCILSEEDYYHKMAEAKYSILPYDMKQYVNRTSGVMIENLFVGTITVAPQTLLEENEIPGIGYRELEELEYINWKEGKGGYREKAEGIIALHYDKDMVKKSLKEAFDRL